MPYATVFPNERRVSFTRQPINEDSIPWTGVAYKPIIVWLTSGYVLIEPARFRVNMSSVRGDGNIESVQVLPNGIGEPNVLYNRLLRRIGRPFNTDPELNTTQIYWDALSSTPFIRTFHGFTDLYGHPFTPSNNIVALNAPLNRRDFVIVWQEPTRMLYLYDGMTGRLLDLVQNVNSTRPSHITKVGNPRVNITSHSEMPYSESLIPQAEYIPITPEQFDSLSDIVRIDPNPGYPSAPGLYILTLTGQKYFLADNPTGDGY
jgi:hypothetical protein